MGTGLRCRRLGRVEGDKQHLIRRVESGHRG